MHDGAAAHRGIGDRFAEDQSKRAKSGVIAAGGYAGFIVGGGFIDGEAVVVDGDSGEVGVQVKLRVTLAGLLQKEAAR